MTADNLASGSQYTVVAWTGATKMTCKPSLPAGVTQLTKTQNTATSATGSFEAGTWQFFVRNSQQGTCTHAGTVIVSGTGTAYTLPLSTSKPLTVR